MLIKFSVKVRYEINSVVTGFALAEGHLNNV